MNEERARAEKLALLLTLALEDCDAELRESVLRVKARALEEAEARADDWAELDAGARLARALEAGMAALRRDEVMDAPPGAVDAPAQDGRRWYFLQDRPLLNCAALVLMASCGGQRAMLRLESEMDLPGEGWQERALGGAATDMLGAVEPIVLLSADTRRGEREYVSLHTGARVTDCVRGEEGGRVRVQLTCGGEEFIPAPAAGAAGPDARSRRDVWLLLAMLLLGGGALYGAYWLVLRLLAG